MQYATGNKSELNPFFYGVTLVHKPKTYTYQADALSANMQLGDTHFERMHTYRVEWEPPVEDGTGGYIKWYTDDEFIYGIEAESLAIAGTEIPSEPMYLLMNTAVSSNWGFPAPCPEGCECSCFECGNPDCACALPTGYCDNFPARFEIDYVRVFQAVNETKHVLGCSPEKRPTELFIKGHAERYKENDQRRPLEPVRKGGEVCVKHKDCGGTDMGYCSHAGFCVCQDGFTGPTCLAHDASYDDESLSTPVFNVQSKYSLRFFGLKEELPWTRTILIICVRLSVSKIYIPNGLVVVGVLLFLGLLISMVRVLRDKSRAAQYRKLGGGGTNEAYTSDATSYQNQASVYYALPPTQKVVTYCVIDGRLID
jgi:hypothetical protein